MLKAARLEKLTIVPARPVTLHNVDAFMERADYKRPRRAAAYRLTRLRPLSLAR